MGPIGMALVSNSIFAAGLYCLAEILWRCERPALAHAIWVLALVKLITPPIWHVSLPVKSDSRTFIADTRTATTMLISPPIAPIVKSPPVSETSGQMGSIVPEEPRKRTENHLIPIKRILPCVWLFGSLGLMVVAGVRARRFWRIVREAAPAGEEIAAEIKRLARRLEIRRTVETRIFHSDIPPMIWFLGGQTLLLLPQNVLMMEKEQRAAIITHELAHLHRGDQWIRLLEMLTMLALWWHPLLWLTQRRLRQAEEEACDAWVVWVMPDSRKSYASTLVEMVGVISGGLPTGASGLGGFTLLQRRLIMILDKSPRKSFGAGGWVLLGILALSLPMAAVRGGDASPTAVAATRSPAPNDPTTAAVKGLLDACLTPDQQLRQAAFASIMTFGPKAVPVLVDAMKEPKTSDVAAHILAHIGPEAVDPLIAVLGGNDRSQRYNALMALEIISGQLSRGFQQNDGMPTRWMLPGYSPSPSFAPGPPIFAPNGFVGYPPAQPAAIAPASLQVLGKIESAVAELTKDADPDLRQRAAVLLGQLAPYTKDGNAVEPLIELVQDKDPHVRLAAADSLGSIGPEAARSVPVLVETVSDPSNLVRIAGVTALGAIGPAAKDAMSAVVGALKDGDPQVRLAAAKTVGMINQADHQQ